MTSILLEHTIDEVLLGFDPLNCMQNCTHHPKGIRDSILTTLTD